MDPKQLVEEVFVKTRVRIAEDDPVLAVVLLNEAPRSRACASNWKAECGQARTVSALPCCNRSRLRGRLSPAP